MPCRIRKPISDSADQALAQQPAELRANVMLQIVRGMMQMYNDADTSQRAVVIEEFKIALAAYVGTVFGEA